MRRLVIPSFKLRKQLREEYPAIRDQIVPMPSARRPAETMIFIREMEKADRDLNYEDMTNLEIKAWLAAPIIVSKPHSDEND